MRARGVSYSTGFVLRNVNSRPSFDPSIVQRELQIIRDDLHCTAVRIMGGDAQRIEVATQFAAELGLEVWVSPYPLELDELDSLKLIVDCARSAETYSISEERFFLVGQGDSATWVATMKGDGGLLRSYNHVAFKVNPDDLDLLRYRITGLGLECLPPRSRVEGEGKSIYFFDDDNHLFELHTGSLRERLTAYAPE